MRVSAVITTGNGQRFRDGTEEVHYEVTLVMSFRKQGKQTRSQAVYQRKVEELVSAAIKDRALNVTKAKPRKGKAK